MNLHVYKYVHIVKYDQIRPHCVSTQLSPDLLTPILGLPSILAREASSCSEHQCGDAQQVLGISQRLLVDLFYYFYVYDECFACVCVHHLDAVPTAGRKRALGSLELESQVKDSHVCLLGTKPRSSSRIASPPNC